MKINFEKCLIAFTFSCMGIAIGLIGSSLYMKYQYQLDKLHYLPVKYRLGDVLLEYVTDPLDMAIGLSYREPPILTGMLFDFGQPKEREFWMFQMKFPLDLVFVVNNKITVVYKDVPPCPVDKSCPIYKGLADMVIELPAGTAAKQGLVTGTYLHLDKL